MPTPRIWPTIRLVGERFAQRAVPVVCNLARRLTVSVRAWRETSAWMYALPGLPVVR